MCEAIDLLCMLSDLVHGCGFCQYINFAAFQLTLASALRAQVSFECEHSLNLEHDI